MYHCEKKMEAKRLQNVYASAASSPLLTTVCSPHAIRDVLELSADNSWMVPLLSFVHLF